MGFSVMGLRNFSTLLAIGVCLLNAQDTPQTRHDVVVVTGSYEPVPLEEMERPVTVFQTDGDARLLSHTVVDFLKLDPSVDLRQRGVNNIQGDVSIRGSTFGQTLVLVDGVRMNDVQTGHHNLNLPLSPESIERVEILKGSGSAFHGSDAVGGVLNFITRKPEFSEFRLRGGVGSFGSNHQQGTVGLVRPKWSQQLYFSRDFSKGFQENRDYRNLALTSRTGFRSSIGNSGIVLGFADRPFGAEQFYGNFNSWERTKTWFASGRQGIGERTEVSFAYRRHTDLFVLFRDRPEVFTNRHSSFTYQGTVRRWEPIGPNAKLHYGFEGLYDGVNSNNLGDHRRGRGAGYVALDVRALGRFSFTLGGRHEIYSSANGHFSPTAAVGAWLNSHFRLRASVSQAFRLPSFTDLYYHDPANRGSPDLRPESAWSYEAGLDWRTGGQLRGEITVFQRRERDGIDYVRTSPTDIWRATNFQRLRFTGLEAAVTTIVKRDHRVEFRYTVLQGVQDTLAGIFSRYAFNYPRHNGVASWQAVLPAGIVARTRIGAMQRLGRDPYAVWDLYFARSAGRIHPFVQLTNLTDTSYEEILGVAMPSRGVVVGLEVAVLGPRK